MLHMRAAFNLATGWEPRSLSKDQAAVAIRQAAKSQQPAISLTSCITKELLAAMADTWKRKAQLPLLSYAQPKSPVSMNGKSP